MPYKVGIIGAARRHQGTGPFIARSFAQLGHQISAIFGTSNDSVQAASRHLAEQYGITTQSYTNFKELIDKHPLDILVISSPPNSHLDYLEKALENNCHVFCEKPLWWPQTGISKLSLSQYEGTIQNIIATANKRNRYIHLNAQWPYTLRDFARLHSSALATGKVAQFAMHLSPQSEGINMLIDASSHGLSMLYQLVGAGELKDIDVQRRTDNVVINFDYLHPHGCTKATFGLITSHQIPKPASYQINGCTVNRTVSLPEYQIQLQSDQQTIQIQDPLDASVEDFLASVDAGLACDDTELLLGARHLYQLIENYR